MASQSKKSGGAKKYGRNVKKYGQKSGLASKRPVKKGSNRTVRDFENSTGRVIVPSESALSFLKGLADDMRAQERGFADAEAERRHFEWLKRRNSGIDAYGNANRYARKANSRKAA
jgi:hypothetical protein